MLLLAGFAASVLQDTIQQNPRTRAGVLNNLKRLQARNCHFQKGLLRPAGGCSTPFGFSEGGSNVNFSGYAAADLG